MRVSNSTAEDLMSQVSALLVRILNVPKIPHTAQYWWERGMPQGYLEAIHLITAESNMDRYHVFDLDARVHLPIHVSPTEVYNVRLYSNMAHEMFVPYKPLMPLAAHRIATNAEDYHQLVSWMRQCNEIYTQVDSAYTVLKQTIDLVTTAGQLKRMVPDLLRYLPTQAREMVANQKRRSSLPGGWMQVDRKALREAVDLIAKCYLLPACSDVKLAKMNDWHWAFKVDGAQERFDAKSAWMYEPKPSWDEKSK